MPLPKTATKALREAVADRSGPTSITVTAVPKLLDGMTKNDVNEPNGLVHAIRHLRCVQHPNYRANGWLCLWYAATTTGKYVPCVD